MPSALARLGIGLHLKDTRTTPSADTNERNWKPDRPRAMTVPPSRIADRLAKRSDE